MIYITFDSNIWIYALDDSWKYENQLDYLELWIEKNEVQILMPKIIIDEWEKHVEKQEVMRLKKLSNFFSMAKEILPSAFFAEFNDETSKKRIIDEQSLRISKLMQGSLQIPPSPEVNDRVISDGILKKAPMHSKSSIADAIIVYSIFHFAKENPGHQYYFISNNTKDFYEKLDRRMQIHSDLQEECSQFNVQFFENFNSGFRKHLMGTHRISSNHYEVMQKRKDRIKNKIKKIVYNPEYFALFDDHDDLFIQNTQTIEFILKAQQPTKEQVIFVLSLIDTDYAYESYFYKNLL